MQYLDEVGQGFDALLNISTDDDDTYLLGLMRSQEDKHWEYLKALTKLHQQVKATGVKPPEGEPWTASSLCAGYKADERQELIMWQLQQFDEEHTRLVNQFAELASKLARAKANERIAAIERTMESLRAELEPLDQKVQALRADVLRLDAAVREARDALRGDSNRRKTEAIGLVIRRVLCRFRHVKAGSQVRSVLVEVKIEPVEGADKTFAPDAPGPRRS